MEEFHLETMLKTTLRNRAPTARQVRDALVDYFGLVGRRFVAKGLQHTDPGADDAQVRRMLVARLALLWKSARSTWDEPDLRDLLALRLRIEQWACCQTDERYAELRRLLDELFLAAAVAQGIKAVKEKTPAARRLKLIRGGAELSPPKGRLRILRQAPTSAASASASSTGPQPPL